MCLSKINKKWDLISIHRSFNLQSFFEKNSLPLQSLLLACCNLMSFEALSQCCSGDDILPRWKTLMGDNFNVGFFFFLISATQDRPSCQRKLRHHVTQIPPLTFCRLLLLLSAFSVGRLLRELIFRDKRKK